jgi:hypothetical protein
MTGEGLQLSPFSLLLALPDLKNVNKQLKAGQTRPNHPK